MMEDSPTNYASLQMVPLHLITDGKQAAVVQHVPFTTSHGVD